MIGVFDSGVGGLSALLPLKELLPNADILYYADTAALPLGEKSDEEIRARIACALRFFERAGVDGVLLACGTASSLITKECKESFAFDIIDIISPTEAVIKSLCGDARVLLLATPAAVRSSVFASALARRKNTVFSLACPRFVRLAEKGTPAPPRAVRRTLTHAVSLAPDAIVLGCTHFSHLKSEISRALPGVRLIDAAACAAAGAAARLLGEGKGEVQFLVTGDPFAFARKASAILRHPVTAKKITQ